MGALRQSSNDPFVLRFLNNSTGQFRVTDSAGTAIGATVVSISAGTQYRVEAVITGGSTTAGVVLVKLYDFSTGTLLGTWSTSTANLTAFTPNGCELGSLSSVALTVRWDDVQMEAGRTTEIGAYDPVAGNTPPSVTLSANQNVAAGAAVTASASATDDGSIASYAWSVVSAASTTTPTLTNANTATVSLTAPAVGHLVTLQCVVTDNLGASTTATTEIRVPSTSAMSPIAGAGSGDSGWTIYGGAATQGDALKDGSSTTGVESPDMTSTPSKRRWRLGPMNPRSALKVTLSDTLLTAASTHTSKVRVFSGSTQITERSLATVSTTPSAPTIDLTAGEVAAITDWGNVQIEAEAVL